MRTGIKELGEEILYSVRQADINGATNQVLCSDFFISETEAANVK